MSAAEKDAAKTQQNQAETARSMKPTVPEIPSDGLCADAACEADTPPPPPGTEPFSMRPVSVSWLTVMAVASVLFFVITVYKKR
jgi:hypothetical protein